MAECFECSVRPHDNGGWVAKTQAGITGPYMSLDFALRVAVTDALMIRGTGGAARVTVLDANSAPRAEQCIGTVCTCKSSIA